ncbi:pantoate--beta-alanine ligase [Desulfovibrio sp. OttesenSCG-928-I05]|nr:pantoate--beta-alanine ligase [Desulfovibrio sp. OttesenSCG-928-I05]
MQIIHDPNELAALCRGWRFSGLHTVLVPTMGYFHEGHKSLMRAGRESGDRLIVSLFVNPAQFGPGEDLAAYPRDFDRDAAIAREMGADVLFAPAPDAMYLPDHATWIEVPSLSGTLCGLTRPTHFRGVCTVVAKLFLLIMPTTALFGEKDWQQLAILRRMALDLNMPVSVKGLPIVREADGLAMSSRNAYLTPEERAMAPALQQGLLQAARLLATGERDTAGLAQAIRAYWEKQLPLGQEEYLSFVHPETLVPVDHIENTALVAAAVRLGKARLIDNLLLRAPVA